MAERPGRNPRDDQLSETFASALSRRLTRVSGIGVILSGLGVVAVGIGIALLLLSDDLSEFALTMVIVGGILLLLALFASFNSVIQALIGRRGKYGIGTLVMLVAFVAALALVDVLAFRNAERFDLTATRQFSLADQTVKLLKDLENPVEAIAFFAPGNPSQDRFRRSAEDLLAEFERRSNDFSYSFVDPDRDPAKARRYGVTQYPTIVFVGMTEEGERQQQVTAPRFQERDFATALLIVATSDVRKRVYILTGHGERDPFDSDQGTEGFGFAADGLVGDNYALQTISLLETPEIPDDAAALIIAGPTKELEEAESQELFSYLNGGGAAVFLLDPNPPQTFRDLLARWAIKVVDGVVIDLQRSVSGQPQTPLIPRDQYFELPAIASIVSPLDESFLPGTTAFDFPGLYALRGFQTSFDPENDLPPETITFLPMVSTNILSCIASDPNSDQCDADSPFGSLLPALALTAIAPAQGDPDPEAERPTGIVLFGDSDFASNRFFYSRSNADLFLNSVNWLTEDISLSAARTKPESFRLLVLTRPEMRFIQYSSWLLLPIGVLLIGAVAWWRRR